MEDIRLLVVEDDPKIYEDIYKRNIDLFNRENTDFQIVETWLQTKGDAIAALRNPFNLFDGAIVDLDLMGTGGSDASGNEVVIEIKNKLRFPTFVVTGTPHNIREELNVSNAIFNVFERDAIDIYETLEKFKEIKITGIVNLLNRNGKIEELIQDIFWNHISTSLNTWTEDEVRTPEQKEASLLRYTILHMLEYLDESKVHPSEFYITKPVKNRLSTGDLVELEGVRYVVLTPACDFEPRPNGSRNVRIAFLLKVIELNVHFSNLDESIKNGSFSISLKDKLEKVITNNKPYFHFIPKHSTINPGIIDFQDKLSLPIDAVEAKIESQEINRIATISMPFLKDLIERYSSYYARQGSPDFNVDGVLSTLLKK